MDYITYEVEIKNTDDVCVFQVAKGWDAAFEEWLEYEFDGGLPIEVDGMIRRFSLDADSYDFYANIAERVNEVANIEERLIAAGVDTTKIWPHEVRDVERDTEALLEAFRAARDLELAWGEDDESWKEDEEEWERAELEADDEEWEMSAAREVEGADE